MSWSDSLIRALVLVLMLVMGIQDLRARKVSNSLTIPFFFAGLAGNLLRFRVDAELFLFASMLQAAVFCAGYYGWMGGADMKVFVGLLGLLPLAGVAALFASGFAGAVVWVWTGKRNSRFPAVTVSVVSVWLMFAMGWSG